MICARRAERQTLAVLLLLTASLGCAPYFWTRKAGWAGWYRIDPQLATHYDQAFSPISLELGEPSCAVLTMDKAEPGAPVYMLLTGLGGDGDEWKEPLPLFVSVHPAAMFLYRWNAFEEREILIQNITTAIEHIARCFAGSGHAIIVLAHSAGGILASYASGRIKVPDGVALPEIFILTVAAPLSLVPIRLDTPKEEYLRDLATSLPPYPTPARGIAVIHLRTSYPADRHMKPLSDGGLPNDPNIGVAGALQISIPPELSHDASILYATQRIVSGEWKEWLPVQWRPAQ